MVTEQIATDTLDRLSDLPKEVNDEILVHLPIIDAVKTSLLSKSWRYRWMHIPQLIFDSRSAQGNDHTMLLNFVNGVLLSHNANISKFELNKFLDHHCPAVDQWLLVLSRKMVAHLVLTFHRSDPYKLPSCVFSFQNLRSLMLRGCVLKSVSQWGGFRCLTDLELVEVFIKNEAFENLVSMSPLLKMLRIVFCSFDRFDVRLMNLEFLTIVGQFEVINFWNLMKLKEVRIRLGRPKSRTGCKLDEILKGLDGVQNMKIAHPFVEFLSSDIATKRLKTTYHHLKSVNLHVNFEDANQVVAVLCLCRSTTQLETLIVTAVWDTHAGLSYEENFSEKLVNKEEIFHHLKTLSLLAFKGVEQEMGFTRFILLNAVLLETLNIKWAEDSLACDKRKQVVTKMMQLQRASQTSKVIFYGA